jgi:hypothetical protein
LVAGFLARVFEVAGLEVEGFLAPEALVLGAAA